MFMIGYSGIDCCPLLDNFENVTITILAVLIAPSEKNRWSQLYCSESTVSPLRCNKKQRIIASCCISTVYRLHERPIVFVLCCAGSFQFRFTAPGSTS